MLSPPGKIQKTTHLSFLLIVFLELGFTAGCSSEKEKPSPPDPATRTVDLTYHFLVENLPDQARDIRAWIPVPPTNEQQQLLRMNFLGDWTWQAVEEPIYANRFLVFHLTSAVSSPEHRADISVIFRVRRHSFPPPTPKSTPPALPQAQLAHYLTPNRLIPIDGKIAVEAQAAAGHLDDPLQRSRALYDHIVSTMDYDNSGTGWGRGDALYACDVRKGNCTDFHSLFIGQARALNIPARFIMGLPLPENQTQGAITGYHCWGEFYLPDKGWLPIDASEARKFPEKREQFFAGLDPHRVAFSYGRDIKLPGAAAEPLNYAIYPHVEIDGITHNHVQTTFTFMDIDDNSDTANP